MTTDAKKYLTAEEILGVSDRQIVDLEVPEWNGFVRLRSLTANEQIAFQAATRSEGPQRDESIIRAFVLSAVDANGNPMFRGTEAVRALREKSVSAFLRVQAAIMKLNGMDADSVKAMQEAAKNV